MKRFTFIVCFSLLVLLMIAAVPVTATSTTISGDSITTLNPAAAQTGKTVTVTITGVNFTTSEGSVRLEKSDENDIEAYSIDSWTYDTIVCKFKISSSKATGKWDVVVVKGTSDASVIVRSNGFGITEPMTLTSISPTTGAVDDDVDFSLVGTNLDDVEDVYLYYKSYDNITADSDFDISDDGKKIKGTFDLSDTDEGTYDVCVEDSYKVVKCDLSFKITTNEFGSIDIASSPSGASILIDGIANGTTPNTVENIIAGSHKIILRKTGYEEWGKIVTVTDDETTDVNANLNVISVSATTAPTNNPAPVVTTRPTTARTTAKSTVKVPTSWADTPTTTAASPVDPVIIIGTIGFAFLALRKP